MCFIYGTIGGIDEAFYEAQNEIALKRGKDPIRLDEDNAHFFHYRIPTNQSTDLYPVIIDGNKIAMNGIVSQQEFKRLINEYGDLGCSLDTAYLLKEYLTKGYESLDTLNYVFAFWLVTEDSYVLANKDYPLFTKVENGMLYFSSSEGQGFLPLGNRVVEIKKGSDIVEQKYQYKNLIYGNK